MLAARNLLLSGGAGPVSGHPKFHPGSTMKLRKILFLIGSVLALSSPSVFSNEKSNDQKTFGLKVAVYVSSSPATKFQGATHLAFGAKDLEIVSD